MDFKELIKFGLEESSEPIIKNPVLRNAMAGGGTPQLVQPSVDGSRPGYRGRPGGNPLFGTEITGAIQKGKVSEANLNKLEKLKEIIIDSNNQYKKTITSSDALTKAGWKGGWQAISSKGNLRKFIGEELKNLNTTYQKMDNYVNNVMLAEDAVMKDFKNPIKHIQKKFGVSTRVTDKWTSSKHYGSKVYADNKELFTGLRNQLSFNKYVNYADGTPRLMSDYSFITQNKMPSSTGWFSGDEPTKFIGETAKRNYLQMKAAGLEPKVTFITDPAITAAKDWQFIDNETGRLFSMDPSIDTVEYQGKTYKNNYLQHKDARKLYKKEFGNLYKLFDEDLAKYMDTMIIGKDGKPIKLDTLLRRQAYDASGKKDFLRRRFMEIDHSNVWDDPFGRKKDGLRLIDRSANQQAGLYKRLDKYKNNPDLLKQKLDEIGYNRKFNNTDELIKFYSDRSTGQGIVPKLEKVAGDPKQQIKILKQMGYRCRKAGGAGESVECYLADVEKTKADIKNPKLSQNERAMALTKQRNALKQAQQIPKLMRGLRRGVQGASSFFGGWIGGVAEGLFEIGSYDYYRGKGLNHEQALQEGMFSKALGEEGNYSGIFGGSEELVEKEKIGTRWDPSGKVNPAAKYADAKSKFDEALDKYNLINANMTTYASVEDWEKDLNAQAKIIADLESSVKPGTPEYEAYQQAEEKQKALMDKRGRDYKSKNRFLGFEWDLSPAQIKQRTPSDFKERQILKQREKEADIYKGGLDNFYIKPGEYIDWGEYGLDDQEGIQSKWKDIYEMGGMDLFDKVGIAGGVSKMAGGGIAGIRRPSAIPPESGPTPYGLPSMLNRVKRV